MFTIRLDAFDDVVLYLFYSASVLYIHSISVITHLICMCVHAFYFVST